MENIYDDLCNYEDVNIVQEVLWFSAKTSCNVLCFQNAIILANNLMKYQSQHYLVLQFKKKCFFLATWWKRSSESEDCRTYSCLGKDSKSNYLITTKSILIFIYLHCIKLLNYLSQFWLSPKILVSQFYCSLNMQLHLHECCMLSLMSIN